MAIRMDLRTLPLTLACLAIVACNNSSQPTPPPVEERITGSERMGWDQQPGDSADFAALRYAIYVDGTRSELADACAWSATGGCVRSPHWRLPTSRRRGRVGYWDSRSIRGSSRRDGSTRSTQRLPLREGASIVSRASARRATRWAIG